VADDALFEIEGRVRKGEAVGQRGQDQQPDAGIGALAVPVGRVSVDVAQLERQLIDRDFDPCRHTTSGSSAPSHASSSP
jgi:hypothetical protein